MVIGFFINKGVIGNRGMRRPFLPLFLNPLSLVVYYLLFIRSSFYSITISRGIIWFYEHNIIGGMTNKFFDSYQPEINSSNAILFEFETIYSRASIDGLQIPSGTMIL